MTNLQREIVSVHDLTPEQKDSMYQLMHNYYSHVHRDSFDHDLSEKNWVLMLREESGQEIAGFSTQMLFPFRHQGKELRILFSGDTIIRKEHWGSMALSLLFGELMIRILKEFGEHELYWLLISKGLRTYKYLPAFFLEYYPCSKCPTPPEIQELMHALGIFKFADSYSPEKGIILADREGQYLKPEYHADAKPSKPHEVFFYKANPGYIRGDELLCLTRLSLDNINPFIKRQISKYQ
ncbi:MAG: hypothetical protein JW801_15005 [Bacteroidales bacterium]|nr:hypothetical protein [Bacteroidales bacterium]